ncbi:MAG TPA: glycosyltransferase [Opitutaceae bacterium]|nr:glycosyltransferase [Opitutaceae bacterium]
MPLVRISAIIPTCNRRDRLLRTLRSLFMQSVRPAEVVIVDASESPVTSDDLRALLEDGGEIPHVVIERAMTRGAGAQRNQAIERATLPRLLFVDDDIDLEPGCLEHLSACLDADPRLGGCSAVIVNQSYHPPGAVMRTLFRLVGCPRTGSLAGVIAGPALNFLPDASIGNARDRTVEWLNLTCTMYRREALPCPALLSFFSGYSLMEDVALSVEVNRRWRLAAVPTARIFHDSQPADYKDQVFRRERMELVNRWFVMTRVVGRRNIGWRLRLLGHQIIMLLVGLRNIRRWPKFPMAVAGKLAGLGDVYLHAPDWRGYEPEHHS